MKHLKILAAIFIAGTLSTAQADVCTQLVTYYNTLYNETYNETHMVNARLLQAKSIFVQHLNADGNFDSALQREMQAMGGDAEFHEYYYMKSLLSGSPSIDALVWLDNKIFESMTEEQILSVLEQPQPKMLVQLMGDMSVS